MPVRIDAHISVLKFGLGQLMLGDRLTYFVIVLPLLPFEIRVPVARCTQCIGLRQV
ncbi:hypothetical protein OCH239_09400 [Roseivivax halodurans JCM 10272]|uniref:Uncharacterized protein n=1 Tax=Roseivivax halodurans JCM 10272 TaxID=1449350 RepID=X7EC34_9RHOB|nr:hypothetical protein OCH239_09400 [Roseivivax halodurans JCM 10272]